MVEKTLTPKTVLRSGIKKMSQSILLWYEDIVNLISTNGIVVDNTAYDTGSFLDRDYDVRPFKSVSIALQNIGANSVDFKILSSTKDFPGTLDAGLTDDDFDKEEVAETAIAAGSSATGTVDLTGGASGSVDGITVDGIEIMSGSVSFNTNLTQTATDVAANITANTSNPNYNASSAGTLITITKVDKEPSTDVVVSITTTITTTDVNMSGGASGKSTPYNLDKTVNKEVTALRIRAKETAGGSPGTIRADIRAK